MIGFKNYHLLVWSLLIIVTVQNRAAKSSIRQSKIVSSSTLDRDWDEDGRNTQRSGKMLQYFRSKGLSKLNAIKNTAPQDEDLIKRMIEQNVALYGGKLETNSLVKRFALFLRQTYPEEIEELTQRKDSKRKRSLLHGMANRLAHLKHRVVGHGTEKISKSKLGCGCAAPAEPTTEVDEEEINKFRLFFSDPPLCRPMTTVNEDDMMTATDLCGHECQCHTEPPATDNDKEIYITRPATRNATKTTATTTAAECPCG